MNCNEARRMITSYVKKELSDKEMEEFLYHIEHCSDCMDELDTYYTVYQALDLLESSEHQDYDFRRMLKEDIRASQRKLVRRKAHGMIAGLLFLITELLLAVAVYTGYEMKGQEPGTRSGFWHRQEQTEEIHTAEQESRAEKESAAENENITEKEPDAKTEKQAE